MPEPTQFDPHYKGVMISPDTVRTELERRRTAFRTLYPSTGVFSRDAYKKHIEFFEGGASQTERAALGGNRVGKTLMGAYEATCHLTGEYPDWWKGRRFTTPTSGWAAGDTSKTVRDIMQAKLIGTPTEPGSGMIPPELIHNKRPKSGVPDAYETVYVKHRSGGISTLVLKSYDQKRESFQGTSQHFIWLDEECPPDIYTECVMRTMKTGTFPGGVVYLTFTPLFGLSDVVQLYIPDGMNPSADRFLIFVTWDDVPHLDDKEKEERRKKIPAFQREARTKGIPQLGAGAIYPMEEADILVTPFQIPAHWRRSYALDVGGGWAESSTGGTAAIWGATNPDTHVSYLFDEYFRGGAEPSVHAQAIKNRGAWMKGVIDPAANQRTQIDGRQMIQMYRELGLNVSDAKNAVEAGIYEVWDAMSTGMLKVFSTCQNWRRERNLYRRDERGFIVKKQDHLMDCTRYWWVSGREVAAMVPNTTRIAAAPQARTGSMGWVR